MNLQKTIKKGMCGLAITLCMLPGVALALETVTVNGSGSALDMMKPMIAAFHKSNKDIKVVMEKPLGSSGAIKAVLAGALDLAISSKPLKPEEAAKGAQLTSYGRIPLVIITEKNVPKTDITTRELEEIYAGTRLTWPGGEKIRLVVRPSEDVDTKILASLSSGMGSATKMAQTRPGMIVAVTDPEAYTTIMKTPGALGASGLTSIITEKLAVNSLTLNGVAATSKTLSTGAYPLFKEINIVTTPKTSAAARKLISFMLSPQGRTIASKSGAFVTAGK